ncbi:peroxidase family 2 domain protein [Ceratobasidium sp. AG-Ba]|nr:peroxidase family 2 domain protein [Ceratobasidium sp. AG-Ba]
MRARLSATVLALIGSILGFPVFKADRRAVVTTPEVAKSADCPFASSTKAKRQSGVVTSTIFDPVKQKIDVTRQYAFQAPKAGDQRGPCPGLNALANHGYLNRNGVTTLTQAVEATNKVYDMGIDLATFLSPFSVVTDGNLLTLQWSIGLYLPPLLSAPKGLSGSHNKYEGDSSPGRGDAYLHGGDATNLQVDNFKALYDFQPEGPSSNYNLGVLIQHREQTLDFSIRNNPHFFYPQFAGLLVSQAAHTFIPAFMSNHSTQALNGVLTGDVLKSFFAVSGTSNNLIYEKGYERIPDNWYRRQIGNDYGVVPFVLDILRIAEQVPEILKIGGNTGKVNSFVGVDIANITGGVYNLQNLLEGNNLACFVYQTFQMDAPDILSGLLVISLPPLVLLRNT